MQGSSFTTELNLKCYLQVLSYLRNVSCDQNATDALIAESKLKRLQYTTFSHQTPVVKLRCDYLIIRPTTAASAVISPYSQWWQCQQVTVICGYIRLHAIVARRSV